MALMERLHFVSRAVASDGLCPPGPRCRGIATVGRQDLRTEVSSLRPAKGDTSLRVGGPVGLGGSSPLTLVDKKERSSLLASRKSNFGVRPKAG